jgi:hypothetical protein
MTSLLARWFALYRNRPHSLAQVAHLGGAAAAGVFGSFLLVAYLIISGNSEEVSSPALLTAFFLMVSVLLTALLFLLFWVLPFRFAKLIAVGIVSYAMVALALDVVLPIGIGELEEGTESAPPAPLWASLVQIASTLGLAAVVWRLPSPLIGRLGWVLAAVIVASTISPLVIQYAFKPQQPAVASPAEGPPPYNIYHVVFDGYYGPWLQWATKELNLDPATFSGFTHYKSARSNYWNTDESYSSFMSGTMYEPSQTITEWFEHTEANSLLSDLKAAGFKTSYRGLFEKLSGADIVLTEKQELAALARVSGDFYTVLDLWALRAAPVGFRHMLFQDGRGPLSSRFSPKLEGESAGDFRLSGDIRTYRSFQQFLRFLDAEEQRPPTGQYIHLYFYPPHSPYQLDRWGSFVGESSYEEQVLLATNMMSMFLERLKELGQFDNNFIILQSDHGSVQAGTNRYKGDPERDFTTIDDATSDKIAQINLRGGKGTLVDARFNALLLVKPPATCGTEASAEKLVVDESLTQLKDFREFVVGVVSGSNSDCKFPTNEFVDIQVGMRQEIDDQGNTVAANELGSGELNVFRIHRDGAWEILPNISFSFR